MIWLTVILVSALAVSLFVKHARLSGPLAFLLGVIVASGPIGHAVLAGAHGVVQFFGGTW